MTRECHVRFCESAGVRSPRATHLVVAAPTREALESYVLPKIKTFLAERGLFLNPDKTKIVNLNEGFDFLGFNVRRYPNGKLLIKPQDKKVVEHLRGMKAWLKNTVHVSEDGVIHTLSPKILGWILPPLGCEAGLPEGGLQTLAYAVGLGEEKTSDQVDRLAEAAILHSEGRSGLDLCHEDRARHADATPV